MKKVLIITYYWPPAGGPGVQRVLKFVKYLPQFGWDPVILTVEKGNFPSIDNSLVKEIPEGVKVYKTKAFEPFELYKSLTGKKSQDNIPTFELSKNPNESFIERLSKWMRANVFVPDAKIGWVKYIVKEGQKIIEKEKPDLIFSSSPPHSLQLGAMKLSENTGLKWVADFRDPWSDAFWQKDINRINKAKEKDANFEQEVLSKANHITTVSKTISEQFNDKAWNEYTVIPNGYDESDFKDTKKENDKFIISYTGTLGKSQQLGRFVNAMKGFEDTICSQIELNFYGTIHPTVLNSLSGLKNVNVLKDVPHSQVVDIMLNSNILLLVIPNTENNKGILTGKIFEYMATKNFILGIGPTDGDAAKILSQTKCGEMFGYTDELSNIIKTQFDYWKTNVKYEVNEVELKKYTRKNLTSRLVKVFDGVA
jgi:glycosyltransferase involved in cell wall biosynthesis